MTTTATGNSPGTSCDRYTATRDSLVAADMSSPAPPTPHVRATSSAPAAKAATDKAAAPREASARAATTWVATARAVLCGPARLLACGRLL
jgi:hypothetical protein